ncbi:MAG: DMT family protein [Opitutales bacterium]
MKTILLLVCSNIFMTFAWYGQLKLKFFEGKSLFMIILASWSIALVEYCFAVPANRLGYFSGTFTGYQLKIIQECITLTVFVAFAWLVLKEKLTWNYAVSFAFLLLAVIFATAFRPGSR